MSIFRFLKPYKWAAIIAVALTFIRTMTELFLPSLMSDIVDVGVVNNDMDYIIKTGAVMGIIAIVSVAFAVIGAYYASKSSMAFGRDLRKELFCHVQYLGQYEVDSVGAPSLITRTTNDINQLQNAVMMGMRMMLMAPLMCIGGIVMSVLTNMTLSWIIIGFVPIVAGIIALSLRRAIPLFEKVQTKLDKLNQVMREGLSGIKVIRAFDKDAYEQNRFKATNDDLMESTLKVMLLISFLHPAVSFLFNVVIIAIIWFGGVIIQNGGMEIGSLMALIQYANQIMFSVVMASMMFMIIPRATASATRINEVLNLSSGIKDVRSGTDVLVGQNKTHKLQGGNVEFDNVSFSYEGAEEPVLKNISFKAASGETIAIIGGTGYGKSTLVNLIPRFFDVTEGIIKIDQTEIKHIPLKELRMRIGYVAQKAFLFSGTIADNIRFGKEDATDEEVMQALKIAQADDFVLKMEGGLNAMVSQGATNLSGGQKQRLCIARAIVRKPQIYIFDDSFSALDLRTELMLRKALSAEVKDATVFIVGQRVSSIKNADRIVVLEYGQAVGIGTHEQLMDTCPVYREIVQSQTQSPQDTESTLSDRDTARHKREGSKSKNGKYGTMTQKKTTEVSKNG